MPDPQTIRRSMIGVGTTLSYQDPNVTVDPPWVDLDHALTIGAIGNRGTFVENSPIKSVSKTFIPGDEEVEQREITFNDVPGDEGQDRFLALADAKQTVKMRIVYPNNKAAFFTMVLNGWQEVEPTRDSALTVSVSGQRSGDVEWGAVELDEE